MEEENYSTDKTVAGYISRMAVCVSVISTI